MLKIIVESIAHKLVDLSLYSVKRGKRVVEGIRKLLIIRIDGIGDFILFSPMLKYYRMLYKNYHISLLVNKLVVDLAKRFDAVDEVISFDGKKFNRDLIYRRRLLRKIKEECFEIVIYPAYSRTPIGDYIVKISQANEKIGFDGDLCNITRHDKLRNDRYYTKLIPTKPGIISEIERNKEFLEALGIKVNLVIPSFTPSRKDEAEARKILSGNGLKDSSPFVVVCPGAGSEKKIWPLERYAHLITWLKKEKGIEAVIIGSDNEHYLARKIESIANIPIIDITGKTSLPTLSAILKKSLLYIGSDTGSVHLAAAVGTPTVCIMGGGHFGRFFPYGDLDKNGIVYKKMHCYGCNWQCKYERVRCIEEITMEQVKDEVKKMICM